MDEEIFENYRQAGTLAASVIKKGAQEIRPGASYLDVVGFIEDLAYAEGSGLAFPLNVSLNEDAAHDTASPDDTRVFRKGDIVKLDLGIHVEGYIADTAVTVDLGNNDLLLEASKSALEHAIGMVRPGVTTGEIGTVIQSEIQKRGYRPISNLTGHGLDRFVVHTGPGIPNIGLTGGTVLKEGMVFAIEPFATTGSGHVNEKRRVEIFSQISQKPVRLPAARQIMEEVRERRGMPFAKRWLHDPKPDIALSSLTRSGVLHGFPVLSDIPGSLVSQHEHTVIVTGEGCVVTTI
ncbi:MAG TPA: type II methionyl aminopeptidase [Methanoregulaceae archaeon]|nr:type II methionyl aminopeptidase [Methanoregulaceae archaeon]